MDLIRLEPRPAAAQPRAAEESLIECHSNEDDPFGPKPSNLLVQAAFAAFELVRGELRGGAGGARAKVRQRQLKLWQPAIVGIGERFGSQARCV